MSSPRLLLFDEPSMGLAPMFVKTIFQIIREIRDEGTTILLVEQNASQALQLADRAYVLAERIDRHVRSGHGRCCRTLASGPPTSARALPRLVVRRGPRPWDATPAGRRALAGRKEREKTCWA